MIEVLAARELEGGARIAWDVAPQLQVTLSRRQHVMIVGRRARAGERSAPGDRLQVLSYLLWDWYDGGSSLDGESGHADGEMRPAAIVGCRAARGGGADVVESRGRAAGSRRRRRRRSRVGADCLACHNGLTTPSGEDVSIGPAWRATMMANSARDPYWQAAVRREILDHPERGEGNREQCAAVPHADDAQGEEGVAGHTRQTYPQTSPLARLESRSRIASSSTLTAYRAPFVIRFPTRDSGSPGASTDTSRRHRRPGGERVRCTAAIRSIPVA